MPLGLETGRLTGGAHDEAVGRHFGSLFCGAAS